MRTYLNIALVPVSEVALRRRRPGGARRHAAAAARTTRLPDGVVPTVVIDHHPAYADYPGVPFLDLREQYGATSTILTEYLRESKLDDRAQDRDRALLRHRRRDAGPRPRGDARPTSRRATSSTRTRTSAGSRRSRTRASRASTSASSARRSTTPALYDHKVVVSLLGEVQYPDMVAEVADFLLRLDGAEWSAAIGAFNGCLYCSIRTTDRDTNAGDLLQRRARRASRRAGTT